jgi:hypothetical protein
MTNLQDMLPWLSGWKFDIVRPRNYVIPAGGFQETFHETKRSGYVLGLGATTDQPTTTLEMVHTGPANQTRIVRGSPFSLNAQGQTVPNGSGFWNSVYNAILGIYTAVYTPDSRAGFWNSELRIRLLAPALAPSNIVGYYHTIIVIEDELAFLNSWRQLFQGDHMVLEIEK